jgi:hypothetical protein
VTAIRSLHVPDDFADRVVARMPTPVAGVVRRLRHEDVFLLSAGLAFYALVSVAPFAILVLWLVSLVAGDDRVRQVADQLGRMLPASLDAGPERSNGSAPAPTGPPRGCGGGPSPSDWSA